MSNKEPLFNAEQVEYLERMFPEKNDVNRTYQETIHSNGIRYIINYIRTIAKVEVRYVNKPNLPRKLS